MLDSPLDNTSEFPIAGVSATDQTNAMRLGIAFNGTQFVYRDFKYDRLEDAVAYAELDIERSHPPPVPTAGGDWLARPVPGTADEALMKQLGIVLEGWRYKFQDYRYDRLVDAVNYAKSQQPE